MSQVVRTMLIGALAGAVAHEMGFDWPRRLLYGGLVCLLYELLCLAFRPRKGSS